MAFSDLISKPVASPLEGLDKSLATGVELANSQYRTQLAMEQNQMEKERLQSSYLDKANSMLPALLKSRGKARNILAQSYGNLLQKGGMPFNQQSLEVLMSTDDQDIAALQKQLLQKHKGNQTLANAELGQIVGQDPTDVVGYIQRSAMQAQEFQQSASLMRQREAYVSQRQERKISVDELKLTNQKIEKDLEKIPKKFDEVSPKIKAVENVLGTPDNPKKNVDLGQLKALLPNFARTVSGEVGTLTDQDVERVFERTVGYKIAEIENYLGGGKAKAPANLVNELRERMSLFKQSIAGNTVNRLTDAAISAQSNPVYGRHYDIKVLPDGEVNVGYAMAQSIDRANDILLNNGLVATRRLSKDKKQVEVIPPQERIFNLQNFISNQAAPPSADLINRVIKQAISQGKIIKYPRPQRMNVVSQQEAQQEE